jgi:lipoprotein-releasing system ATP-binding protein
MLLTLENVGHGYSAQRPLFADLTTTLSPGSSYAIVGPSGSGKSTLLGIISGDVAPRAGRITRPVGLSVNWVFQNPHGVARRTALDHVVLPFLARGYDRPEAEAHARDLLEEFGLARIGDEAFRQLSGGEAQRLMLARAVAANPALLLVDEPTAQLDRHTSSAVNDSLSRLSGRGCIVVVATHDPDTRDSCSHLIDLADYQ